MAFAHPDLIRFLSAVKYPYNVNSLTLEEATRALGKREQMQLWVDELLLEREQLSIRMEAFTFVDKVFPSDANFLLIRVDDSTAIYAYLEGSGIIVRDRSSVPLAEGCLRITVGSKEENRKLLQALEKYEKEKQIKKA